MINHKVRKAKPTDAFHLLQMMKDYLNETNLPYPPVEDMSFLEWALPLIKMGSVWVAVADKRIVGSIASNADRFRWNDGAAFMFNEWFYVRPDYRKGGKIARELLAEVKKQASQAKVPYVMGITSGDRRVSAFIERNGFEFTGSTGTFWTGKKK